MQQRKTLENHPQQEATHSVSLLQRLLDWGPHPEPPVPSNADRFEDSKLDQRVRESGEW